MDLVTQVQTLDEAVCIFICANDLGKGMNLSLASQTMGKMGSLGLIWQLVKKKYQASCTLLKN